MKVSIPGSFLLLGTIFFFNSCIPARELSFESLKPAEYNLPGRIEKSVILNASYPPQYDTSDFNILGDLDKEEMHILDTLIVNNIFNGFFYVADESPLTGLRNSVYVEERSEDTTNFLQPIAQSSIDFLLDEFEADLLISLEYFGMNYDYWIRNYSDYGPYGTISLDRKLLWRIYNTDSLIYEEDMRDTLYWRGFGSDEEEIREDLPYLLDIIEEAFWYGGEEFGKSLTPTWEETERAYFWVTDNGVDKSLDPAYLRKVAENSGKIRSYKAFFNLSVYFEEAGDIEAALENMNAALDLRPGASLAKYYKKQQIEKLEEFNLLKEQFE